MAYEESIRSITLNADSSLAVRTGVAGAPGSPVDNAGNQYRAVKVTGAHQCGLASAVGDNVIGVLQNKPQVNAEAATVAIRGVTKVRMATTVAAGAIVYLAADGRGTTVATGAVQLGIALNAGGAVDVLVPVLLRIK